jgi:hypothetical protein
VPNPGVNAAADGEAAAAWLPSAGAGAPPRRVGLVLVGGAGVAAPKPQFYLGGPGSGAPWHLHKDAANALLYGRKRWFLLPPRAALYSALPFADWLSAAAEAALDAGTGSGNGTAAAARPLPPGMLQCTQRAGDVLYVPPGWGHAVLNMNTSVGVAIEFSTVFG